MRCFVKCFKTVGTWMNFASGAIAFLMMMLTVTDVVGRYFGKPIIGTYELVSIIGATVIGLAIPKTSLDRGHVCIDLLTDKSSEGVKNTLFVLTRIPGIALFVVLTSFLFLKGYTLSKSGQVSPILQLSYYYLIWLLACCCLIECLVLVADIFGAFDDKGERK